MKFTGIFKKYGRDLSLPIKAALVSSGFTTAKSIISAKRMMDLQAIFDDLAEQIFFLSRYSLDNQIMHECRLLIGGRWKEEFHLGIGHQASIAGFFDNVEVGENQARERRLKRWREKAARGVDIRFGPELRGNKLPKIEWDWASSRCFAFCFIKGCNRRILVTKNEKFDGQRFYKHLRNDHLIEEKNDSDKDEN